RQFMAEGHGSERTDVFYNDFALVGPGADPAGLRQARTLPAVMAALSQGKASFVSRGDDSGTHKKEQALWRAADLTPQGAWYLSAGAGQPACLRMASERSAYTLSDRGSFLALARTLRLRILYQGGAELRNPYAVIVVTPQRPPNVNVAGARRFAAFLTE